MSMLVTRAAVLKKCERPDQCLVVGWTAEGLTWMREHASCSYLPRTMKIAVDAGRRCLLYDYGEPVPSGAIELAHGVTLQPLLGADLPETVKVSGWPIIAPCSDWLRDQLATAMTAKT